METQAMLLLWVILVIMLPLIGSILWFLVSDNRFHFIASTLAVGASFFLLLFVTISGYEALWQADWVSLQGRALSVGLQVNGFTNIIALLVLFISLLVHLYSTNYMAEDPGIRRYFAFLGLFTFSMLGIVFSTSLIMIFIFWELVGLSSYLLIGFWYKKKAAHQAANKAFIVNRIGDIGFLAGIGLIWAIFGTTSLADLSSFFETATLQDGIWSAEGTAVSSSLIIWIGLALFCGVLGKSAQFPLTIWLPDAMEGPTPVSALIHAATMVAAGVFLLARVFFMLPDASLTVIAWVGAITATIGAITALTQTDIKKVLAYSTVSQLGYMVLGIGVGAWYAAILHLITHAFFKACLFLTAGSVIHAVKHSHEGTDYPGDPQDMRNMGGIQKNMPFTFYSYLIAMLSLAGVPFFSGFISKDAIIISAWTWAAGKSDSMISLYYLIPDLALFTVLLTAIYMGRHALLTFLGQFRHPSISKLKEVSPVLYVPTVMLALLSLGIVFSLNPFSSEHSWLNSFLMIPERFVADFSDFPISPTGGLDPLTLVPLLSTFLVALGFTWAWIKYRNYSSDSTKDDSGALIFNISLQHFYLNQIYNVLIIRPYFFIVRGALWMEEKVVNAAIDNFGVLGVVTSKIIAWFDRIFVDGLVSISASFVVGSGGILRKIQSGNLQSYIAWALAAIILLLFWLIQTV